MKTMDQGDRLGRAVGTILFTVMTLSLGDAIIKTLSAELGLWQIFVLRGCVALPLLFLVLWIRARDVTWWPKTPFWSLLRSLMLTLMWVVYYAALPHLQLPVAAAAYYTLPLFITLFSAVFVGEPIGRVGWLASGLGFLGVLFILRPAGEAFNGYALLPLVSAILYALAMILTRTKCRDEHPLILATVLNLTFVCAGLLVTVFGTRMGGTGSEQAFLSPAWTAIGGREFLALLVLGLAILVASIGTAFAYQNGPSSVISTFDFAYVGFAVLWGVIFFGDLPDMLAVLGMGLITGAGILAVRRQR